MIDVVAHKRLGNSNRVSLPRLGQEGYVRCADRARDNRAKYLRERAQTTDSMACITRGLVAGEPSRLGQEKGQSAGVGRGDLGSNSSGHVISGSVDKTKVCVTVGVRISPCPTKVHASGIGAFLRDISLNGQILAGNFTTGQSRFAGATGPCMVSGSCGSTLPASHAHLLFRTPSFRGQACGFHNVLPAFFFVQTSVIGWHKTAQMGISVRSLLNNSGDFPHLALKLLKNQKGQTSCESRKSFLQWRPVQGSRRAETRPASRRCLAAEPAPLARQSSVPTRCWVPWSARQATCFTARPRTTVDNEIFGAPVAPTVIARHAVVGPLPRGGVLRFQNFKTEDVPCSTRS